MSNEPTTLTGAQIAGAAAGAFVGAVAGALTCGVAAPAAVPAAMQIGIAIGGYSGAKNPGGAGFALLSLFGGTGRN